MKRDIDKWIVILCILLLMMFTRSYFRIVELEGQLSIITEIQADLDHIKSLGSNPIIVIEQGNVFADTGELLIFDEESMTFESKSK